MKANFTYDEKEVQEIVLNEHIKNNLVPKGMMWVTSNYYGAVKIEAVLIEEKVEEACQ